MIFPTTFGLVSYLMGVLSIAAALYVAFGRNLFYISIALFFEILSLSIIFLGLGYEFLAVFCFFMAIIGPVIFLSFVNVIHRDFKVMNLERMREPTHLILPVLGFIFGLSIGLVMSYVLSTLSFMESEQVIGIGTKLQNEGAGTIGEFFLGKNVIVFELMAVMVLALVIGSGLLLRRTK